MPSGKQSRRTRHTPPPPTARAGGSRRASPKVLLAALALVCAISVAVVLVIVLTGGSSSSSTTVPEQGSLVDALPGAGKVESQFHGIPQTGNVLGSPNAPVMMIEYVDLQCPYCRTFAIEAMPSVISRYIRTGKVKIEQRLLGFIGADSQRGRLAAIAAGEQDKLFNLTELLYYNQGSENTGWLDHDLIVAAAASIPGLAVPKLLTAAESGAVKDQADALDLEATNASVGSTPTVFVGKTGQKPQLVKLSSLTDPSEVTKAIEAALK